MANRNARAGGARLGVEVVLLVCAILAVYWRSLRFGYVMFDDYDYTVLTVEVMNGLSAEGIRWAFTTFHLSNWHPLTWISFMTEVSLFGPGPGPQHTTNLVLHTVDTLLVYSLVAAVIGQRALAFCAALLFGVHALHVESVAWIAERKDLLCSLFYLLALRLHLVYAQRPRLSVFLAVQAAALLALMSKPMAVTLPLALLLLDYWPQGRLREYAPGVPVRRDRLAARAGWLVLEKLPVAIAALLVCVLTVAAQQRAMAPAGELALDYRLQNAVVAYAIYLRQFLLPTGLTALYRIRPIGLWSAVVPACALLGALSIVAIGLRRTRPWLLFGWAWFVLTLVPVIGIVQVGSQAHADRYMYLPSLGLLIALAMEIAVRGPAWLARWRVVLLAVLAFHAGMAWIQVGYWANAYLLNIRMLEIDPGAFQAHIGLSGYFLAHHELEKARDHASAALSLNPTSQVVYMNLGGVELEAGDYPQAERMFRMALDRAPMYPAAMNNLGLALEHQGRIDEARACYLRAKAMDPALRGVDTNLARMQK